MMLQDDDADRFSGGENEAATKRRKFLLDDSATHRKPRHGTQLMDLAPPETKVREDNSQGDNEQYTSGLQRAVSNSK